MFCFIHPVYEIYPSLITKGMEVYKIVCTEQVGEELVKTRHIVADWCFTEDTFKISEFVNSSGPHDPKISTDLLHDGYVPHVHVRIITAKRDGGAS